MYWHQFPTLFLFHSFPNEFVSGNSFLFLFPFSFFFSFFFKSFFLLADQQGGGGGHGPLVPPSYASGANLVNA